MKSHLYLLSLIIVIVTPTLAAASVLIIDFNEASATNLSNTATTLLIATPDTTSTSIGGDDITIEFTNFQDSGSGGNAGAFSPGTFAVAADDYFFVRAATGSGAGITATLTFSGLAASFYDISIASSVASSQFNETRLADFSINGSFGTGDIGDDFDSFDDGFDAGTLISWSNIAPTAGEISIIITTPAGDALPDPGTQDYITMLNGLQISPVPIPEPGSLGLNLETANGWRGVWHGQFGGVPYKYSGGLGTYPWQHNRIIAYSPLAQKTFFVIGSAAHETLGSTNVYESGRNQVDGTPLVNLRGNTLHTVIGYMDHRTGRVGRPHILSRKPGAYDDTDPHENPVLEIDKRGYLWVFIPSHGPDRKHSFIYRSALPGEIDAWVEVVGKENKLDPSDTLGAVGPEDVTKGANFSYPNPHYLPDEDAFLFLHTKYASWARRYTALSTGDIQPDMSVDWSNRKNLFEVEQGHYCVSGQRGSRVGMALNLILSEVEI